MKRLIIGFIFLMSFAMHGCTKDEEPPVSTDDLILFWSNRDGNGEIYSMDKEGTNVRRLTDNTANDFNPQWSPDGRKIVFESARDGNREIYAMNADGSGQTRLTENTALDWLPQWSPDGTKIMYQYWSHSSPMGIYVMDSGGNNKRLLFTGSMDYFDDPQWMPDGKEIILGCNKLQKWNIYILDVNSATETNLTENSGADNYLYLAYPN